MQNAKKFFGYLQGKRLQYFSAIAAAVGVRAVINILDAYINKQIFNSIEYHNIQQFYHGVICCAALIVIAYLYPYTRYWHITIVRKIVFQLKVKMFRCISAADMQYFDEHHSGDIIQRISNDADSLKQTYFTQVFVVCSLIINGGVSIMNMMLYSKRLAIISIAFSLISVWVSLSVNKKIKSMSKSIQLGITKLTEKFSDTIAGFEVIKLYAGARLVIDDYIEMNDSVTQAMVERTKTRSYMEMINFLVGILGSMGTIIVGIMMVSAGDMDYGTIMAIVSLQLGVSLCFSSLGGAISTLTMAMAKAIRVFEVLDMKEEHEGNLCEVMKYENAASEVSSNQGNIILNDIIFAYKGRDATFVHRNFEFEKNKKTAIVGESGNGKSTLLKLLMGYYPIESGDITIGDKSIKNCDIKNWRKQFAYVSQDSYLFDGTIRDNIRFGNASATEEDIIHASKLAYADEFINTLPDGYETKIQQGGSNLSGGQQQRITIARAFLKNASIILLDEPTSALDLDSEQKINLALEKLMENRTVLMVTHRVSMVGETDVVVTI